MIISRGVGKGREGKFSVGIGLEERSDEEIGKKGGICCRVDSQLAL
jgi:hypothetical protein